jgi:superfamily I DNA and/or RNA helicase
VEEAGEVLEAHTLTALLPSVEHAFLIGDHQQLRPTINNFELSSESHGGKKYSLDMSLFERLISPPAGVPGAKLPFATLETQRRMHPSISDLIRQTLYPRLTDGSHVSLYPNIAGVEKRLFWLDHQKPETGADTDDLATTSKSNDHEVNLTASLVAHLLSQGEYQSQDIAVITPYLAQLFKIRTRLANQYEIVLDERDVDALEQAGIADLSKDSAQPVKTASLLQRLKVASGTLATSL